MYNKMYLMSALQRLILISTAGTFKCILVFSDIVIPEDRTRSQHNAYREEIRLICMVSLILSFGYPCWVPTNESYLIEFMRF